MNKRKLVFLGLTSAPYGRCSQDRMAIFAEQQNLGISDGNLLCGDMTGQHSKWSFINDDTTLRGVK